MLVNELEQCLTKVTDEALTFAPNPIEIDQLASILATFTKGTTGVLLVEVTDDDTPQSIIEAHTVLEKMIGSGLSNGSNLIRPTRVKGKTLLVVNVSSSLTQFQQVERPAAGGTKNKKETRSSRYLRHLMQLRQKSSFERRLVPEAGIGHLDWQKIERYVADNVASLGTNAVKEALIKRGYLVEDELGNLYPTNAAVLLFGREPERFIPSAEIIAVCYSDLQMSDSFVREDIRGPLPDQIRQAETFVQRNLEHSFQLQDLEWNESPALPLDVVREVIVNAVAHRAYDIRGDNIRLFMFADRLECYSPGPLPGHVTVDNLLTERLSRNEMVGQVLTELGLMDRLGYGLNRVVRRMAEEKFPPPKFEETAAGFKVTLFTRPLIGVTGQIEPDPVYKWMAQGLYERQVRALRFVLECGRLTPGDYSRLCPDISRETSRRDLANLVERDLLLRVGDNGSTYYILK